MSNRHQGQHFSSERKEKERAERDLKLWRKLDGLANLDYAACGRVVKEALEVQDEHRGKRLDENLLACFARVRGANLHGLWLRDVRERILDSVYRIGLCMGLNLYACGREDKNGPGYRVEATASLRRPQNRAGVARAASSGTCHRISV
jgi:hypothetical protein